MPARVAAAMLLIPNSQSFLFVENEDKQKMSLPAHYGATSDWKNVEIAAVIGKNLNRFSRQRSGNIWEIAVTKRIRYQGQTGSGETMFIVTN